MRYIDGFEELFNTCIKQEKEREISIFQGNGYTQSFGGIIDFFRGKDVENTNGWLELLSELINCKDFQCSIVALKRDNIKRKNKKLKSKIDKGADGFNSIFLASNEKLLKVLDWNWIKINYYENFSKEFPSIVSDWRICLLDDLYKEYKRIHSNKFEYNKENPLAIFYMSKGINLNMENNYGLCPVLDIFDIKANGIPKLYDKVNDTHIIIRFLPNDFVQYLNYQHEKHKFDIAFRPDYELCGEHLKDLSLLLEGVVFGNIFDTYISQLPNLSELSEDNVPSNRLIIKKETMDLTFEELVDDFEVYEDYIVTQVVHVQYKSEEGKEYVTHIDHEYVFYEIDDYEKKQYCINIKGSARRRFKTFKIDNAKIEFVSDAYSNIVFQTLKAFFKNDILINEYFGRIIQKPSDTNN